MAPAARDGRAHAQLYFRGCSRYRRVEKCAVRAVGVGNTAECEGRAVVWGWSECWGSKVRWIRAVDGRAVVP